MQGGGEVQAGAWTVGSGTATPACGARGGRPPFARLCAPHEKTNYKYNLVRVAPCCESRSNGPAGSYMRRYY
eukprot:2247961-Prymnesium_polylepis.1